MMSSRTVFIFIIYVLVIIGSFHQIYFPTFISAESPQFSRREIRDKALDIDTLNKTSSSKRFINSIEPIDILTVNYFSNGTHLSATIWLRMSFEETLSSDVEQLGYGMYIDADSDHNTGWEGVDYQLEIAAINGTWIQTLGEFSSSGIERILDTRAIDATFFGKNNSYVLLSLNLDALTFPDRYKIIFYSTEKTKQGDEKIDFTEWVNVPAPEFELAVSPSYVSLRPGESTTTEVKINSTTGFEPTIHFSTGKQDKVESIIKPQTLHIPALGMSTIPLEIRIKENAMTGPESVFIFANASFSPELISTDNQFSEDNYFPKATKNITRMSSIAVEILPKLTDQQRFIEIWNIYGSPMTFVYGIIAGVTPLIYNTIRKALKKSDDKDKKKHETT